MTEQITGWFFYSKTQATNRRRGLAHYWDNGDGTVSAVYPTRAFCQLDNGAVVEYTEYNAEQDAPHSLLPDLVALGHGRYHHSELIV